MRRSTASCAIHSGRTAFLLDDKKYRSAAASSRPPCSSVVVGYVVLWCLPDGRPVVAVASELQARRSCKRQPIQPTKSVAAQRSLLLVAFPRRAANRHVTLDGSIRGGIDMVVRWITAVRVRLVAPGRRRPRLTRARSATPGRPRDQVTAVGWCWTTPLTGWGVSAAPAVDFVATLVPLELATQPYREG
jgi:hypothetical protein